MMELHPNWKLGAVIVAKFDTQTLIHRGGWAREGSLRVFSISPPAGTFLTLLMLPLTGVERLQQVFDQVSGISAHRTIPNAYAKRKGTHLSGVCEVPSEAN